MGRQSRPKSKPMGKKLKLIRRHSGLSQVGMLAVVRPGFDPENRAVISQYEKGITDPDFPTLLGYARYARISTDVLIDDELELTPEMMRQPTKVKPPEFSRAGRPRLLNKAVGNIGNSKNIGNIAKTQTEDTRTAGAVTENAEPESAEMQMRESKAAEVQSTEIEDAEMQSGEVKDAEVQSEEIEAAAAPPTPAQTPAQTPTPTTAHAAAAEESPSDLIEDGEARPEPLKRRLKDRLLEAADHELEHFSTWLPSRLLDQLDDLYHKQMRRSSFWFFRKFGATFGFSADFYSLAIGWQFLLNKTNFCRFYDP